MPTIISLINLKGGVGKTSTTVALAEFLRANHEKRVLVIDLDPQTNATIGFISENRFQKQHESRQLLAQLFRDQIENTSIFDIDQAIIKDVSNLKRNGRFGKVDLLTSGIELINIQDSITQIAVSSMYGTNPVEILKRVLSPRLNLYDYVLIDCPPSLGAITLNAILISQFYIVPVIPDYLSTYGLPMLFNRIDAFKKQRPDCKIAQLGMLINARRQLTSTEKIVQELRSNALYQPIFETEISMAIAAAKAFDTQARPTTLREKYPDPIGIQYAQLTKELLKNVEQRS